jgi:hypothetical protein
VLEEATHLLATGSRKKRQEEARYKMSFKGMPPVTFFLQPGLTS